MSQPPNQNANGKPEIDPSSGLHQDLTIDADGPGTYSAPTLGRIPVVRPEIANKFAPADSGEQNAGRPRPASNPSRTPSLEDSCSDPACMGVHLVRGSEPGMSGEMSALRRKRLRSAALALFIGFATFLIWSLIEFDFSRPGAWLLFGMHALVVIMLGAASGLLCRKCDNKQTLLGTTEAIVFGLPALFFVLVQSTQIGRSVNEGYLLHPDPPWMMLIFIYALFIPNRWQRAAMVIAPMAAMPVLILLGCWFTMPKVHDEILESPAFIVEIVLLMSITGVVATFGVHTINSLREEAFSAKQLGQYRLRSLLGSGGMGEVYLAEHQLMKRPCAIKIIRPEKAGDAKTLARFEREVRTTAKLSHWNNIHIFDYGRTDDGTFYYVMEYLPGKSLHELVKTWGPLRPERAIHFLRQFCDALREAHDMCLVHRDIKPANMFAAHRGGVYDVAKLLDFGLAKPPVEVDDLHLTAEGVITGSPLFMSPEQATGDGEPDARSDIYSLGASAYYLLTGKPPFEESTAVKVMLAHASKQPRSLIELRSDIPDDLQNLVMRCLEKRPEDRFQSVDELAASLDDCQLSGEWNGYLAQQWWEVNVPQVLEESSERLVPVGV